MNNQTVPFLDLVTPHLELEDELVEVFREAIQSARFIGGPQVEEFEKEFAGFCDTQHCAGVGSGTDAFPAVRPRIKGRAYITGLQQFVLHPEDPFPEGFRLTT